MTLGHRVVLQTELTLGRFSMLWVVSFQTSILGKVHIKKMRPQDFTFFRRYPDFGISFRNLLPSPDAIYNLLIVGILCPSVKHSYAWLTFIANIH